MSQGPTTGTTKPELKRTPDSNDDGPKVLNVGSAGFLIPFGIAIAVIVAAWLGLQGIVKSTGPWAIQAAQKGLVESGLPALDRAALTVEIERLNAALVKEAVAVPAAVQGVDGLLKEPLIPQLLIQDVIDRRLPASGLDEEARASARASLGTFASYVDAGLLNYGHGVKVLGPLTSVADNGRPPALDDAGLVGLVTRAEDEIRRIEPKQLAAATLRTVTRTSLIEGYRARIDGILN